MKYEVSRTRMGCRLTFDISETHIEIESVGVVDDGEDYFDIRAYGSVEVTRELLDIVCALHGVKLKEDVEVAYVPSHVLFELDYDELEMDQAVILDASYVEAESGKNPYVRMKDPGESSAGHSEDLLDMLYAAVGLMDKDSSYKFEAKVTAVQQ